MIDGNGAMLRGGLGALLMLGAIAGAAAPVRAAEPIRIVVQNQGADQDSPEVAAFSPDDALILTMSPYESDEVLLRDATSGVVINRLILPSAPPGHRFTVKSLAFTTDNGHALASGLIVSDDGQTDCHDARYAIDLVTMRITATIAPEPAGQCVEAPSFDTLNGLLATSHKGGLELHDSTPGSGASGLVVMRPDGSVLRYLQKPQGSAEALQLRDAAYAPDGGAIALIAGTRGEIDGTSQAELGAPVAADHLPPVQHSTLIVLDPAQMQWRGALKLDGYYTRARWIDAQHVLIMRDFGGGFRNVAPSMHDDRSLFAPPAARVIDTATMTVSAELPMRCYLAPLPHGGFVAAGLANCNPLPASPARGLVRFGEHGWQPLGGIGPNDGYVEALAVSGDGARLAVVTCDDRNRTGHWRAILFDTATMRRLAETTGPGVTCAYDARFAADGHRVIIMVDDQRLIWRPGGGAALRPLVRGEDTEPMVVDSTDPTTVSPGATGPRVVFDDVVARGFVPGKPLIWAVSRVNGLRLWDRRSGQSLERVMLFAGGHTLVVTPEGRYDTNLGPDTRAFDWLVADEPERSLPPQTFMRTYYTPGLARTLYACAATDGGCAHALPAIAPPLALNRVLPQVRITAITPGAVAGTADVAISIAEGIDPFARNGQTHSGLYDVRLFIGRTLVGEFPERRSEPADQPIAAWRAANALTPDADGSAHVVLHVVLPSGPDARRLVFSAYAFNSDRVKSDTVSRRFVAPVFAARERRTFVLAIGIDDYAQSRLRLHYAGADARLIARQLKPRPRPDVYVLSLDGDGRAITRATIVAALDLLAGRNRDAALAELGKAGIDGHEFVQTTPDDTVIVTFSGHGWADAAGNFYLFPADARWRDGEEAPDRATLLSAADLAVALERIAARDFALVIDACHSAASVDTATFKPGPMGDPGLGQLAWDKGIRVLAAAGPADLAHEDAVRKQGLLTYALAAEGLDDRGFGEADLNHDARIMLDEWLRYALQRLPALSRHALAAPLANGGRKAGAFLVLHDSQALPPAPQQGALFDFNHRASTTMLRVRP